MEEPSVADLGLAARPRRLRRAPALRDLVAETELTLRHLIQGHFVLEGRGRAEDIPALPGIRRASADRLLEQVERDLANGVRAVLLFGVAERKDESGSAAADPRGAIPRAVAELRRAFGQELLVFTDVCLCGYTSHGHCGLVHGGEVVNDPSVAALAEMALCHAESGADFVCPSDMMDGRVRRIRARLDAAGFSGTGILSYTAKYASAYYGPFRAAAQSAPAFGDRRSYQMDPRNRREALRELRLDVEEGADIVMVKPALAYLDVVAAFAAASEVPVCAYNVSGEYRMVQLAAQAGIADERSLALENLTAIRRAGADLIVTYHAAAAAAGQWLPR